MYSIYSLLRYIRLCSCTDGHETVQTVMNIFDPGRGDWKIYPGREAGRIRGRLTCDEV